MSITFVGGRLVSKPGRGRGKRWNVAERARLSEAVKPSAREWFPALREQLVESRPLLEPERVFEDTITVLRMRRVKGQEGKPLGFSEPVLIEKTVRTVVPAVFGAPAFRNVIENGKHV